MWRVFVGGLLGFGLLGGGAAVAVPPPTPAPAVPTSAAAPAPAVPAPAVQGAAQPTDVPAPTAPAPAEPPAQGPNAVPTPAPGPREIPGKLDQENVTPYDPKVNAGVGVCAAPPEPVANADMVAGVLDIGAPSSSTRGGGLYTRSGWAGLSSTTLYDPGCSVRFGQWVGDRLPGMQGLAVKQIGPEGPNRTAHALMAGVTVLGAVVVGLVRLATGSVLVWEAISAGETLVHEAAGAELFLWLFPVALVATGVYFMWRAERDDLAVTANHSSVAGLLLMGGLAVTVYQLTLAPSIDGAITETYRASGQVATGAPDPASTVGDLYAEKIALKGWGIIHLGPDMEAVDKYAGRLLLASSYSRAEAERAASTPAARKELEDAKGADWKAVAEEVRAEYPRAYDRLAGKDADGRAGWALVTLLAALPVVLVTGFLAAAVAMSRLVLRFAVAAFPAVAVITQHPKIQGWGITYVEEVVKWALVAVAGTASFAVVFRVVAAILSAPVGWAPRVIAVMGLCWGMVWVWSKREKYAARAGFHRQAQQAKAVGGAAGAAAGKVRGWASAPVDYARGVYGRKRSGDGGGGDPEIDGDEPEASSARRAPVEPPARAAGPEAVERARAEVEEAASAGSKDAGAGPVRATPELMEAAMVGQCSRPTGETLESQEAAYLASRRRARAGAPDAPRAAGPVARPVAPRSAAGRAAAPAARAAVMSAAPPQARAVVVAGRVVSAPVRAARRIVIKRKG